MRARFDKLFSAPAVKRIALSFAKAFAGVFVLGINGVFVLPTWSAEKAALAALLIAAVDAGLKAVQVAAEKP